MRAEIPPGGGCRRLKPHGGTSTQRELSSAGDLGWIEVDTLLCVRSSKCAIWALREHRLPLGQSASQADPRPCRAYQEAVDAELMAMELTEADGKGNWWELLTKWRMQLIIATALAIFQQLTANANLLNYSQLVFETAGCQDCSPAVVLGVVKLVATVVAVVEASAERVVQHQTGATHLVVLGQGNAAWHYCFAIVLYATLSLRRRMIVLPLQYCGTTVGW